MNIGLVLPGFSADEHDWCIPALYHFVRALAVNNRVCVFALEYPYRRDRFNFFGATVYALNGRHRGKLYSPRLWSDALAAIFAEHRRMPFDLLHAFWINEPGLIALTAARRLRVPMMASVAGGELVGLRPMGYGGQLNQIEKTIVNWVVKNADGVTVGSRYLQKIAARWRKNAAIAPLGVDLQMFAPRGAGARAASIRIINVASLLPVKQQELLLDAFARLTFDARLEIIGAGGRDIFLRERAARLQISDRVTFAGELAHDALPEAYRAADIFVQASLHEAQGMAVLEAAASGVTIAGTPVGILPELAERGAAIATDSADADTLARAIRSAAEKQRETGRRAREIAVSEFSLDTTCARWIGLYNGLKRLALPVYMKQDE